MHTKITIAVSAVLLSGGAILITAIEWANPATMGPQPPLPRPAAFRPTTAGSAVPSNRGSCGPRG